MRAASPGEIIDGFRIVRPLGQGGMGSVYLAHDLALDRPTALKFIRGESPSDAARERFRVEARALARLQHPNVVGVYRFGEADGRPFLAYEFVEGTTLDRRAGPLPWREVLAIGIGLAEGVAAAHARGVLHRDLKPANVMLTRDGTVKLLDFGLAHFLEETGERTRAQGSARIAGTPAYVAPERWLGAPASPAADVWALGMILRVLLTGRHPLDALPSADLPRALTATELPSVGLEVPDAPPLVADFLDRCLALRASRRPVDGGAMRDLLSSIQRLLPSFQATPSPDDTRAVLEASLARVTASPGLLGERFYARLFADHPSLRPLFPTHMIAQRDKIVGALRMVVEHFRSPDVLLPLLRDLGRRHAAYGTLPAHFSAVGTTLLATLAALDPEWTPRVAHAWGDAWERMERAMVTGLAAVGETREDMATITREPPSEEVSAPPVAPRRSAPPPTPSDPPSGSTGPDTSVLPSPITRFYGREEDVERVAELVEGGARLVTVLGMGGVGKTRLVLEAARRILRGPGWARVAWAPLADARGRDAAVQAILRALGLREIAGDPVDVLVGAIARGRTLLVLDGVEHLADALADDLHALLERASGLVCVVASQRALELFGETIHRLGPLPVPDADAPPEVADSYASVRLFLDRARLHRPGLVLDAATTPLVVGLVRRLEGLPLALELAAVRAGQSELAALVSRLDADLDALADRSRNRPERQRSLVAALRWSVDLLPPERRALLARLSVFPGELDAADVVAVLGGRDVEDGLADLAQSSLLVPVANAPGRYRAPAAVRAHAATLLPPDEGAALAERFREHFLGLAAAWHASLGTPEATPRMLHLDRAWPNLMAALDTSPVARNAEVLGRLPVHVLWSGRFPEMLPRYDVFLEPGRLATLPPQVRAPLVRAGHRLSLVGGDARRAALWRSEVERCLREPLGDAERLGLESELVIVAINRGELATAEAIVTRHLAHEEARENRRQVAVNLDSLARIAFFGGRYALARERSEAAWGHAEAAGDPQLRESILLARLGIEVAAGDAAAIADRVARLRALRESLGRPVEDAATLEVRVRVAMAEGRLEEAWALATEGERVHRHHGRLRVLAQDLLAAVAFARGDFARAAREAERAEAGLTTLLRFVDLPNPTIVRARALLRLGDPAARAALVEATRRTLAIEGHRHAPALLAAWREAAPERAWPEAAAVDDGGWRASFTADGEPR